MFPVLSRTIPTDLVLVSGMVQIVRDLGWRRIGILYLNDEYCRSAWPSHASGSEG